MLPVRWEIFGAEDSKLNGQNVLDSVAIQGGGAFKFEQFFKALTGEQYTEGQSVDTDVLVGREATITVAERPGSPYLDVKSYVALEA